MNARVDRPAEVESALEGQRRQQLVRATMACVAEVGVEKTTMWMVASRAGVSTGMILYYFPNKKDLINAAVDAAIAEFSSRLEVVTQGTFGPERLKESIRLFLTELPGVIPANFLIQYRMAALNNADIRQRSLLGYQQGRESLAKAVLASQERGLIGQDINRYALADLIYTLANGLSAEMAAHPEVMSEQSALEVADLAIDSFLKAGPDLDSGSSGASTPEAVERLLMHDPEISGATARDLADAFQRIYDIARREGRRPA